MRKLTNHIMRDGTRCFVALQPNAGWSAVRDHAAGLEQANVTGFLTDSVTEAWIDFDYAGYKFNINDAPGDYSFFVNDPACPDTILQRVVDHFAALLEPGSSKPGSPSNTSLERTRGG
jgi:hypothetical protein